MLVLISLLEINPVFWFVRYFSTSGLLAFLFSESILLFHDFKWPTIQFHDFPGLESEIIQLFRQRLSHESVKAYATMPIGIMGSKSLALLDWGSRWFRNKEREWTNTCLCCSLPQRWNTLKFTQATVKTAITHNNFRDCRVSFSPFVRQPFSKQLYIMHQSIPAVPIPPGQPRCVCSRYQCRWWGIRNFIAARELGIGIPPGNLLIFLTSQVFRDPGEPYTTISSDQSMTNLLVCGVVIHCLSMTMFQTPRYIFLQYGSEHNPAKKTKKKTKLN